MNVLLRRKKLGKEACNKIEEFSTTGIKAYRNDRPIPQKTDILFRWGCTSNMPSKEVSCINSTEAIHLVNNKAAFRSVLNKHGLCPKTWFTALDPSITYPCIVRPCVHSQGKHLYYCEDINEVVIAVGKCQSVEPAYYISEYIKKVAEYRVYVVSGRAICVANKTPKNPDDIAWNVALGGHFSNVKWADWPLTTVRRSIEAFNLSGLDFGGVDVIVDTDGKAWVLEINSAPTLTSEYRQRCFSKAFDYIVKNGKTHFADINTLPKGNYKKFIHEAIKE